jgi:hypothetical protein
MIRMCILGTRADGERKAKEFGVNHIGFESPGIDEGLIGSVVIGMCDDEYVEQVGEWFNADPPDGVSSGSMMWFKNA